MLLLSEREQLKYCEIFIANKNVVIQREKKKKIILAAAKLLKTKIKEMKCCSEAYPNTDKVGSLEFCKQFAATIWYLLSENMFTSTNKNLKVFDSFNSIKRDEFVSLLHSFDLKSSMPKCFCCVQYQLYQQDDSINIHQLLLTERPDFFYLQLLYLQNSLLLKSHLLYEFMYQVLDNQ